MNEGANRAATGTPRVLVLGGTAEGRELAEALTRAAIPVVSSLAGRVSHPRLPVGQVRVGGFGGVDGLAEVLTEGGFTHLVDATHPFATTMRRHAAAACRARGVAMIRLARPGWGADPRAGGWSWVGDYDAARAEAERLGSRPFLTSGRQTLPHFIGWDDRPVLVRVVEPLDIQVPSCWTVVHDRGPFSVDEETELLERHGIDVLVTKDSGGSYTHAKLEAAERLAVPVVVVRRPPGPPGVAETDSIHGVIGWLGG